MLTLPSSRKFLYPALALLATTAILRLLVGLSNIFLATNAYGLSLRLKSWTKHSYSLQLNAKFNASLSLEEQFITNYHASYLMRPPHPYVLDLLQKCKHKPNPQTNHIRLASTRILNISMVPSIDDGADFKGKQYFNPALIPLPSHLPHSHQYLLVSRLVTSGAHQESHVCFADTCSPPSAPMRPGTRICTDEDIELLGKHGGMRCVTRPERVNIGSTPAKRCSGSWSTFVDIPGFHDPRMFWSGRGEPIIEVNSGSMYGCVGLWVQDLRAVYPPLEDLLKRKGKKKRDEDEVTDDLVDDGGGKASAIDLRDLGAEIGYPYLTELTRNPRMSRNDVEKNWVLFFPGGGEAWVQYDVMGKAASSERDRFGNGVEHVDEQVVPSMLMSKGSATSSTATGEETALKGDLLRDIGLQKRAEGESDSHLDTKEAEQDDDPEHKASPNVAATGDIPALNSGVVLRLSSSAAEAALISSGSSSTTASSSAATSPTIAPSSNPLTSEHAAGSSVPTPSKQTMRSKSGRTLAQLLSHGFTTPNLTSPFEPPCFDLGDHTHTHDSQNNTGHWHQGSNSLRLILCTRDAFRTRSCLASAHEANQDVKGEHDQMMHEEYENILREEGLIVHLSIIHRKFSNSWELPMRYERYFLVWEARLPFRILGVSKWPVLFGRERARPWNVEEDVECDPAVEQERRMRRVGRGEETLAGDADEGGEETEAEEGDAGHRSNQFMYTPSIAWAWRGKGEAEDEELHRWRGHGHLGTGYLSDEAVVGIGVDDVAQGFVKVKIYEVLACMRVCNRVDREEG